ncbi:unnamed protein product [Cylindrotheca closterium]|uniref:Uncharacterized protein n=1 Tax=Cylindrotheca closterium TaxID=2856 RepID=A0AAD2FIZ5_9STRA|nr:unnamed protein product [Cylindrotheca closterium]
MAPVAPTNTPTRAPVVQVTEAPVVAPTQTPVVMVPTEELLSLSTVKSTRNTFNKRMVYQGSISDIRMYGKPRRIVHRPGAFGGLPVVDHAFSRPPVGTRSPTIEPTKAPTPYPTPRVFHKVCRDGRVVEIDGTHSPTVLPSMAPTYSPVVQQQTRPPAFVGYVWGNGYGHGNDDDNPRWSFTKNEGKLLFDHPNLEKAIYRGDFSQVRRQFKRRVDTMSPW